MNAPRPADFDRIARLYRWAEYLALGPALTRTRNHFVSQLNDRRQALILGDGDGRFTARLLAANPTIRIHAVDRSRTMLHLLRTHAGTTPRLTTTHADALTIDPAPGTDLLVTHFFLDCLTQHQVDSLVARIAAHVAPGTLWLVSEFRVPAGVLAPAARLYIRVLYLAFRILTGLRVTHLPDHATPLRAEGFERVVRRHRLGGLLTTELWRKQDFSCNPPEFP